MIEFMLGFVCGAIVLLVLLPLFSKWIMKILLKRQVNVLSANIQGKMADFNKKFSVNQEDDEQNDKTEEASPNRRDSGC